MKILLLMKRFSTNRDMIMENFGREVRLFSELSRLGQTVTVLCADQTRKERASTKLNGMRVEIRPFGIFDVLKFLRTARKMADDCDIVVGSTHPILGWVAHVAAAGKRKMVYDIRDNYETYNFTNMPLLKKGIIPSIVNNHVIKRCHLAVCVSESLQQKVAAQRKSKPTVVVQNGVNTKFFRPLDKAACRKKLGLPQESTTIVYTGHISKDRGADKLIEAFGKIRKAYPDAVLLLSGQVDKKINVNQEGIFYRELPKRKDVVLAINAGDVAVVSQPENETSKYAFPYKLMEYMACGVPVVATAVGDVKKLLGDYPDTLAQPGNAEDLADKIIGTLKTGKKASYEGIVSQYTWEKLARKLNSELVKLR